MKKYISTHAVKYADLNHHATLFAGQAAYWMMESAVIASALARGDKHGIVFKNIHKFSFDVPAEVGDIIRVESCIVRLGGKSITMRINFINEATNVLHAYGYVTFVSIDPETRKAVAHGIELDETTDAEELKWREEAEQFFK